MVNANIFRYALLGASHLVASLSESEMRRLNSVVLFGSAAAGIATEESDIDLFFDVDAPKSVQQVLRARLNKAAESFYLSSTGLEFKMKSVSNEFSITVGKLYEWENLAQSIASSGIILYGKYEKKPPGLKAYTILSWENAGKAKGSILNRFYGYKAGGKRYEGLLERYSGTKLGKATIMVPADKGSRFISVLENHNVSYSRRDLWG